MNADDLNSDIPGMKFDNKYSTKKPIMPENNGLENKEMSKTKKELEKLANTLSKKYPFMLSLSILPPQMVQRFVDEEEVPKETEKYLQLYMVVPEEKFKEIKTFQPEVVKELEKLKSPKGDKQKAWIQIKTPVDIWEICLDSKFDLSGAIAMSFPLYDKGFLGALRMTEIHKSLVLQKFEKYVVSYVVVGSFIRGEATPTSDVDVSIIINDTDVKRMPRLELKERLRNIIYQYVAEAAAIAGVKNTLHIQSYLLTDFWESVKDAHPVIFTFIRDGVPLYDRGTFMPWKSLLKMGKLKPSPEAIDMFMRTGDKTKEVVERRLMDAMIDIYWGIITPSQALIMLYGEAPPTHGETVKMMENIFVKKEKMLEMKYVKILAKVIQMFKDYEHKKLNNIPGKEVDVLMKEYEDYMKRIKELRTQIEKSVQERTLEEGYKSVFDLLEVIVGKKSQEKTIDSFEKDFVKKGKFTSQNLKALRNLVSSRKDFKKGKLTPHKVDEALKNSRFLVNDLIEYNQRCELENKKGK